MAHDPRSRDSLGVCRGLGLGLNFNSMPAFGNCDVLVDLVGVVE